MNKKSIEILHENRFGNISICRCCRNFNVCLGNALLSLDQKEFAELSEYLFDMYSFATTENTTYNRKFVLKFNEENLMLSFTRKELNQTQELIEISKLILEVNTLLN